AIPIFQYGGMEHVGAIQYRESTLFLDQTATESQLLSRAKLIAHETSHMWFGDLVTMNWFNDVWMKEVFANFMADKIVNPAFPEVNHDLLFVLSHYPGAYGEDRTKGANPIRQELDNLKNAGSLYGGIIYHKAPIMMRQLELATGKKAFQEGIQEYIKTYANDNAVWDDLVSILDTKTNLDLKKWSEVWVNQSSRPVFSEEITYDTQNTIEKLQLIQSAEDGSAKIWPQTFKIGLVYADSTHILTAAFKEKRLLLEGAQGLPKPQQIIYNYDGMGYGIFPQKDDLLQSLLQVEDEVARGYSYINVHENLLNAGLNPISVFELYKKGLVNEKNALILNRISSQMQNLYWTYLTDIQRESHKKELEDLVYNQLQQALPANIKKTLFGLFESIAYSPSGKDRLYAIWSKETLINNLKLNEDDYTGIAMQLALFGHEHTD
ncbi:MAG: M1 family aminopeptidase, partial [Bacteroidota bacterium]|nr:M1 family aminopeptidase [Bacteroidota bacterium]